MQNVVIQYWELGETSKAYGNEVAQFFSIAAHEHPAGFFNTVFDNILLTIELLNHYERLWSNIQPTLSEDAEKAKEENTQRVIFIQKMSFIEIMSSFEFVSKRIVQERSKFGRFSGNIYLSKIMTKTRDIGLIDDTKLNLWDGVIRLRDSLIHNNGISEETASYRYPDFILQVTDGKMIKWKLNLFGLIIKWLINESKGWIIDANK